MRRRLRQSPPFLPFSTGIFLFFSPLPPPSAAPPPPPPPPLPLHFLFPRSSTSTSFPSSTGSTLTKSAFPSNFFRSRTRRYHRPPRPFSSFLPRADRAAERKRAGKLKLYRRFFRFLSTARRFPYPHDRLQVDGQIAFSLPQRCERVKRVPSRRANFASTHRCTVSRFALRADSISAD